MSVTFQATPNMIRSVAATKGSSAGATSSRQLQENLTALEVLPRLDAAVLERIEAIVQTKPTGRAQY